MRKLSLARSQPFSAAKAVNRTLNDSDESLVSNTIKSRPILSQLIGNKAKRAKRQTQIERQTFRLNLNQLTISRSLTIHLHFA